MRAIVLILSIGLVSAGGALAQDAPSQPVRVFGFAFGEAIKLPPCKIVSTLASAPKDGMCITKLSASIEGDPAFTGESDIKFFPGVVPPYVASYEITASFASGLLVGIRFSTFGLTSDPLVMSDLRAKFGEPSLTLNRKVKTAAGGEFDAPFLSWMKGDVIVTYTAVSSSIRYGTVIFSTPQSRAMDEKKKQEIDKLIGGSRPL